MEPEARGTGKRKNNPSSTSNPFFSPFLLVTSLGWIFFFLRSVTFDGVWWDGSCFLGFEGGEFFFPGSLYDYDRDDALNILFEPRFYFYIFLLGFFLGGSCDGPWFLFLFSQGTDRQTDRQTISVHRDVTSLNRHHRSKHRLSHP